MTSSRETGRAAVARRERAGRRSASVVAAIDTVGNSLILQLCFLVAALGIVTILPAAIALQLSLRDLREGDQVGAVPFGRHFASGWRRSWRLGLVVTGIGAGFVVGIPFWLAVQGPIGTMGIVVLIATVGIAAALYLAVLCVSAADDPAPTGRAAVRAAAQLIAAHPVRAVLSFVLYVTWVTLLALVPPLVLVGSGLAPALIAERVFTVPLRPTP